MNDFRERNKKKKHPKKSLTILFWRIECINFDLKKREPPKSSCFFLFIYLLVSNVKIDLVALIYRRPSKIDCTKQEEKKKRKTHKNSKQSYLFAVVIEWTNQLNLFVQKVAKYGATRVTDKKKKNCQPRKQLALN